jgi:hypothetical protein
MRLARLAAKPTFHSAPRTLYLQNLIKIPSQGAGSLPIVIQIIESAQPDETFKQVALNHITANLKDPEFQPRRLMNMSKSNVNGWSAKTTLRDGLVVAFRKFLE